MSKRQTHSQPNIEGIQYPILEQEGEKDRYRLTGRDKTTGELVKILGSKEEIEEQAGKDILTSNIESTPEGKAKTCADKLQKVFLRLKENEPLETKFDVYKDPEGQKAIWELVDGVTDEGSYLLFDKLKEALGEINMSFMRPSADYFINKSTDLGIWFNIYDESGEEKIAA